MLGWNQRACSETVGLFFPGLRPVVRGQARSLKEDAPLAMEEYMRGFMEEAEPEDVLPAVTKAHLDQRLRWGEPPGCAVRPSAAERIDNHHGDACAGADANERRFPFGGIQSCQPPDLADCFVKALAVKRRAFDRRRLDLA